MKLRLTIASIWTYNTCKKDKEDYTNKMKHELDKYGIKDYIIEKSNKDLVLDSFFVNIETMEEYFKIFDMSTVILPKEDNYDEYHTIKIYDDYIE